MYSLLHIFNIIYKMYVRSRIVNILNKFAKIKRNIQTIERCTNRKKFAIFGHKWIFAREQVKRGLEEKVLSER